MSRSDGDVLGMTQIFGTAPPNRGFNLVLLADGFTAAEQSTFDAACAALVTTLTATSPFGELSHVLNVFRVNVSSDESGADDPVTPEGGTGAQVRTFFDSSFGGFGLRRLLICDTSLALSTAGEQMPQFTAVLVVVNSEIYGGSGGAVGTYSLAPSATEIAIHEMGHTAFTLADEYSDGDHSHHPASEPREPNVTTRTSAANLKWASLLTPGIPLPTMTSLDCGGPDTRPNPFPAGTVGLYEGGNRFHCRVFRPEHDCKMRTLGTPFCAVCQDAISQALRDRIPTT
jgi:hypothetical protein